MLSPSPSFATSSPRFWQSWSTRRVLRNTSKPCLPSGSKIGAGQGSAQHEYRQLNHGVHGSIPGTRDPPSSWQIEATTKPARALLDLILQGRSRARVVNADDHQREWSGPPGRQSAPAGRGAMNMMQTRNTVAAIFDTRDDAEDAINALKDAGIRGPDIGLVARNRDQATALAEETGTKAGEGAATG